MQFAPLPEKTGNAVGTTPEHVLTSRTLSRTLYYTMGFALEYSTIWGCWPETARQMATEKYLRHFDAVSGERSRRKTREVRGYVMFIKDRTLIDCKRPRLLKLLNLGGGDFNSKGEINTAGNTPYVTNRYF